MNWLRTAFSYILTSVMALSSLIFGCGIDLINKTEFTIDASQTSYELTNPASNVNVWSIDGNPFVDKKINEENNIFDFVNYVQFMQCTGGNPERDLFVDPYDKTVLDDYDFTVLIENCRGVLELGAKPVLKLGSVPLKYSEKADPNAFFGTNIYPPDDYDVYYNYIAAIAQALVDEFGKDEVLSWRFGVMTEYENASWFMANSGDPEESAVEYCKLYDYTVQALIDVIGEDVYVGAHSMTVTEGLWDEHIFINHCANGTNYKTGEKGSRICYLAASFYDFNPGTYTDGKTLPETIAYLRDAAEAAGLKNLIYGIDEGRILSGNASGNIGNELLSRTCGYTYQAAYDARLYKQMFENRIDYFSSWYYLSNGLLEGNPTVSYHVARNAAKFGGCNLIQTIKTKSSYVYKSEVDAVSALSADGKTLRIMAYNFKNDVEYKYNANLKFTVKLPENFSQKVKVTTYTINDDCNYFDEWIKDREIYGIGDDCFSWSPEDPCIDNPTTLTDPEARAIYQNELYAKYTECSKLTPVEQTVEVVNGEIELSANLNPNAVVFYEITEC